MGVKEGGGLGFRVLECICIAGYTGILVPQMDKRNVKRNLGLYEL